VLVRELGVVEVVGGLFDVDFGYRASLERELARRRSRRAAVSATAARSTFF
jgi:hypothetical protein